MIPNLVNCAIGLWLVSEAVLLPETVSAARWPVLLAGIAVAILGLSARRSDFLKWPGDTNIALGIALILMILLRPWIASEVASFWLVFFAGCVVGIVSLWSALYRGEPAAAGATKV
jgi:hypothetical protein